MSDKVVVHVSVEGNKALVRAKDGSVTEQPLTDKVAHKMAGLDYAYFYAKPNPDGYTLLRFGPWSGWVT